MVLCAYGSTLNRRINSADGYFHMPSAHNNNNAMDLSEKIKTLPLTSGVYIMKDENGNILYVGKAVSLRKRVQSYFRKGRFLSKTDFLVSGIKDIECMLTASEAEALILEASL